MILWLSWAAHHFNKAGGALYFDRIIRTRYGLEPADPESVAESMRDFRDFATVLDGELAGRAWLLGDRVSYADFRVASALPFAEGAGLPVMEFPNIARWNTQLLAIDAWREPFQGLG